MPRPARRLPGRLPPRRLLRTWPIMVLTVVLAAAVGLIGSIAGPKWDPAPLTETIVPTTTDVSIPGADSPGEGTYVVTRTVVEIDLGEVTVPGWLFEPEGAPRGPGVVFIHGAGTGDPDAFEGQVHALASAGIRALVPAKRMDTYSTRQRDYAAMAVDYLASWRFLRAVPGVDPARVGLYGESEGAWIAPIAGAREPEVAFMILASAPVVSPREQAAYATATYLRNTNVPRAMFRAIPRALGAKIPGGGFEYADFDVGPFLEEVDQPVLMAYGTADASMPIVQGAQIVRDRLGAHGNDQVTVRYFQNADHGLKVNDQLAPGFTTVLADWVWGLPRTADLPPHIAGASPTQDIAAGPVPEPRWYASGDFLIYSALAVVLLSLAGVGLCAGAALRHREWGSVARHAVATVLAAFAVVAVFVGYAGQVADLATSYRLNDALVLGGWALVHLAGLFAVAVAVLSMRQTYMAWKRGEVLSPLTRTGAWACHAGALSILVIAAYWGVFPGAG